MYTNLTIKYAPNYLATETCIATILTFLIPLNFYRINQKCVITIKSCLVCFFNTLLILLDSRVGSIGIVILDLIILLHLLRKRNILLSLLFTAYVVGNIAFIGAMCRLPFEREIGQPIDGKHESRLLNYYNVTTKVIVKSPIIGYGTGDTRYILTKMHSDEKIGFERYLNAHNQFLQTSVALGLLGLICIAAVFVCFTLQLWNRRFYVLLAGIAIIALFMMTESVLERQAGVHFCSFAFCWVYALSCKGNKKEKIKRI